LGSPWFFFLKPAADVLPALASAYAHMLGLTMYRAQQSRPKVCEIVRRFDPALQSEVQSGPSHTGTDEF
jgi:hypothetical protein